MAPCTETHAASPHRHQARNGPVGIVAVEHLSTISPWKFVGMPPML